MTDRLYEDRKIFEIQCAETSQMLSNKICDIEKRDGAIREAEALLKTKDELIALCAKKLCDEDDTDYESDDDELLEIYSQLT